MKIGYFADGIWAHNTLNKILSDKELNVVFICVRFEKPDQVLCDLARKYKIPLLINQNINSPEFLRELQQYEADLFVSMSFDQIFKKEIINLPRFKIINCHAGKLPYYRGRNILNWVLINDEKEFGVTVHYVDEGIDTGDIICQETYAITDEDNYATLLNRAYKYCAELLYQGIKCIQNGAVNAICQREIDLHGTYCGKREDGDEFIDWNQTSREIFNFIRAICKPGPMARSILSGKEIKINKAVLFSEAPIYKSTVGQVVGMTDKGIIVKTKDSTIEVQEYTYDGKIKIGDRMHTFSTYIFGNYGVCKEVYSWCKNSKKCKWGGGSSLDIIGFIGKESDDLGSIVFDNKKVILDDNMLKNLLEENVPIGIIIPFGTIALKQKIYESIKQYNHIIFPNIIHKTTTIEENEVKYGKGNIVAAGNIIAANMKMGDFNLINMACTIGHDVQIGNFNTINPMACISGNVKIGSNCLIGANSTILQGLEVGDNVVIGAGAVVTKNVESGTTVIGVPAHRI